MRCKKCGQILNENADFCGKCGTPTNKSEITNNQKSNTVVAASSSGSNKSQIPTPKPSGTSKKISSRKKWIVIGCCGFVILCALSCLLFFTLKDKKSKNVGTVYKVKAENVAKDKATGVTYVDNIVVMFFNKKASDGDIKAVISSIDGEIVGSIPVLQQYQVKIPSKSYDELKKICEDLERTPFVDAAFVDIARHLKRNVVPNDPWSENESWNNNSPEGANWWIEAIKADDAWKYDSFFNEINIGVVDAGVDTSHEDLSGKIQEVSELNNCDEHGTHVCGIIGAVPNNGTGITGIVWNSDIYTRDFFHSDNQTASLSEDDWYTTTDINYLTVDLIVSCDAKVINLSLGNWYEDISDISPESCNEEGRGSSEYLLRLLDQGYDFLIVQSAGNGDDHGVSFDAMYNGCFASITPDNCSYSDTISADNCSYSDTISADEVLDRVIVVGAAQNLGDNRYMQAEWSNAGSNVDICAPGFDIYSCVPGGYDYFSGTSMAAPIVTGVSALVWSINPELTGKDVRNIICDINNTEYTVEDNPSSFHSLCNEYGLVNAKLSVEAATDIRIDDKSDAEDDSDNHGDDVPEDEEQEATDPVEDEPVDAEHVDGDDNGELSDEHPSPIVTPPADEPISEQPIPIKYSGNVKVPEDVVLKYYDAENRHDATTVIECFDPISMYILRLNSVLNRIFFELNRKDYDVDRDYFHNVENTRTIVSECYSSDYVYFADTDFFRSPSLCKQANVYVKVQGQEANGIIYINNSTPIPVKNYLIWGFRIDVSNQIIDVFSK